MDTLKKWLNDFLDWLLDVLLYVPKKIIEWLFDAFAWLIEAIPVPDFFVGLQNAFSNIPDGVMYFLNIFEVSTGLAIIVTASILRFIIRRLPVVG